jgi:hypothetical protein
LLSANGIIPSGSLLSANGIIPSGSLLSANGMTSLVPPLKKVGKLTRSLSFYIVASRYKKNSKD